MRRRRKFRVRWWMWGLLGLGCIGLTVQGALTEDAPQAIFGAVSAAIYGFFTGILLMHEDVER